MFKDWTPDISIFGIMEDEKLKKETENEQPNVKPLCSTP